MKNKTSKLLIFIIYLILAIAGMLLGVFLNGNFSIDAPMAIIWVLSILSLIISIIVSLVKRKATGFFKVVFTLFLITSMYIVGVGVDGVYKAKYVEPELRVAKLEEYKRMGMNADNTKVTTNQYGHKIYGTIVGSSDGLLITTDPALNKIVQWKSMNWEEMKEKGYSYTYSKYFSEAYGNFVYFETVDQSGVKNYYNEDGDEFIVGSSKYADDDPEFVLKRYKAGNIIAEKIDAKYRKKNK